jgi:hypothetical protein
MMKRLLIKNCGEEFILTQFEDWEEIIRLNHADGHHLFRSESRFRRVRGDIGG